MVVCTIAGMSHHLVGIAEIADMLGVSRQRAHRIYQTHADFPSPEVELKAGLIWSRESVEDWMCSHPDRQRPGRRPKPASAKEAAMRVPRRDRTNDPPRGAGGSGDGGEWLC